MDQHQEKKRSTDEQYFRWGEAMCSSECREVGYLLDGRGLSRGMVR